VISSGGAYFRIMPFIMVKYGFKKYLELKQPVLCYIHPWEFNKDQPRRKINLKQMLLQLPMTYSTEKRLKYLLSKYNFVSIKDYLGL